jgi:hypothetical protein
MPSSDQPYIVAVDIVSRHLQPWLSFPLYISGLTSAHLTSFPDRKTYTKMYIFLRRKRSAACTNAGASHILSSPISPRESMASTPYARLLRRLLFPHRVEIDDDRPPALRTRHPYPQDSNSSSQGQRSRRKESTRSDKTRIRNKCRTRYSISCRGPSEQ